MPFADLHCDTMAWMRHERLAGKTMSLRDTYEMHVNLEKLRASGYYLQNFALFVNTEETKDPWGTVLALAELYVSEVEKNRDVIRLAFTPDDIRANREKGLMSAILTIEGPAGFGFDPALLDRRQDALGRNQGRRHRLRRQTRCGPERAAGAGRGHFHRCPERGIYHCCV